MTRNEFLEMLDRISELGNSSLSELRAITESDMSRGECMAEIIYDEFGDITVEEI